VLSDENTDTNTGNIIKYINTQKNAEVSKNLTKYRSENNFVRPLK